MRHKRVGFALMAILAFSLVLVFTSCEKLNVSRLQANYHFNKANQFFKDGKFRKAITEYEDTLKYNPKLVAANRFLGESYKSLYKPGSDTPENKEVASKALEAFTKAYEAEPTNKEIIFSLGDMYDKLKNFNEAEKYYLMILKLEPSNMGNYYVLAEFYKRYVGENAALRAKAESMYLRRIELDPENPQGYAYMANYFENLTPSPEVFDQANEFWKKRIALEPNSAEAWLAMGVNRWSRSYRFQNLPAAERLKAALESLNALEKASSLDPDYPEPYSWLSVLHRSVLAKLEPEKEARHNAEADRAIEKFQDTRKRAADKKKLEQELKKAG
jgi:tetratricopeptide (TPR) repeat protein